METKTLRPVEGFSVSHVDVAGVDMYGIRDYAIIEREDQDVSFGVDEQGRPWVELKMGFAVTDDLPNGPVEITFPARDIVGNVAKCFYTIPRVENWNLLVHDGGYQKGWTFTYRGTITDNHGTLDVTYIDDPTETRHRISTKAFAWPGR